jgi:hypothetical protein
VNFFLVLWIDTTTFLLVKLLQLTAQKMMAGTQKDPRFLFSPLIIIISK